MRRAESIFRERFKNAFPGVKEAPQLRCGVHAYPSEGSWGRRGTRDVEVPVKIAKEVFSDSDAVVATAGGNGRHG
jgi:hypothetical protein